MRTLDLETAVREIKQGCERAKGRGEPPPFSFVVGAGISYPPVPLARDIIEHCKVEAQRSNLAEEPTGREPIDVYSHWFGRAYSQPADRQRYLRDLIEKAFISRANFRLAHLLLDETVARTVVTPNFDDFLSRALSLFGKTHIVCDHPQTVERISMESTDVQIIHVHGRYWYYDCANLRDEIVSASRPSEQNAFTMASLLDDVFRIRTPLVLGYSGWEGDVIMGALKRRLAKPLPHNIYWFCYRSAETQDLPAWLKQNANFCEVLPRESSATGQDAAESGLASDTDREPFLRATSVLDALIREFGLQPPALTQDPLGFFARQLREALLSDESEKEADVYAIRALIQRVERARGAEERLQIKVDTELEAMREAVRRSDYRSAVREAQRISLASLDIQQLLEVVNAMSAAAESLLDDSPGQLSAYDLTVEASDLLSGQPEMVSGERVARALLNKGITLRTLNRSEEELAAYAEVLRRFSDAPDLALRDQVAKALFNKGVTLASLNRNDEAIGAFDEVLRRFLDAFEPALRERVAKALFAKGIMLGALKRTGKAFAAYDEVVRRFSDSPDLALREQVAGALLNKGIMLGTLQRSDEAIAVYDELLRRFSDAPEPTPRERVAKALFNKGITLGALKRSDEAIAVYDEVVRRFSDSREPALREQVAGALLNKGITLGALKRSDEAIAAYDELLRRFTGSPEPALREAVARALQYKQAISAAPQA